MAHKNACKKTINPIILKNITKTGGTTDEKALFDKCTHLREIEEFVDNSKFNILKIKKKLSSSNYQEHLLKVLYLEIFEYLFIQNASNIECKKNIELSEFLKQKNAKDNKIKEELEKISI